MKKLLCFALLLTGTLVRSQSVPNGGFESWNVTSYENPTYYQSSNLQHSHGYISPIGAVKVADPYQGSFAVKLTTSAPTGTNQNFAYVANGDPGKTPAIGGTPYAQKPTGVRFYYKSNIMAGDSALFLCVFKKAGVNVGLYIFKIGATQTNYTLYNATFSPALPVVPDTVVVAAASSNAFANVAIPGNSLQVDSVTFTGVTAQPANLNGSFESWQTLSDYDLVGWNLDNAFQRTTDFYTGSYALELLTNPPGFGSNSVNGGQASTGQNNGGPLYGGYPFSNLTDTLIFYYKYLPANPSDSANVSVLFKKNFTGTGGQGKNLGLSATYKKVKIVINQSTAPDTMVIQMNSSRYPTLNSYVGADFKIDNMYLSSQMLPVSNFTAPVTGCVGAPIQLTDNSSNMANAWNWILPAGSPSSSTAQNPVVVYSTVGTKTITMIANNMFGSGSPVTHTILINPAPVVNANSLTTCGSGNAILAASGALTYTWSTGSNSPSITVSPSVTTMYTVTGTAGGCTNTAVGSVNVPVAFTPSICMVTVDSIGKNNIVLWDKTAYLNADTFFVYRDIANNVYKKIGAVYKSNPYGEFRDTVRSLYTANGDPTASAWRYKICYRDTCGHLSAMSPYHKTIFIQNNAGNFSWNDYQIEGQPVPVPNLSNYIFRRDNNANGNWQNIQTLSAVSTAYT
ncbi:MAG: PKD domain-containing protein, partial [Bacteroidia bacterium]